MFQGLVVKYPLSGIKSAGNRTAKNYCSANPDHRPLGRRLGNVHVLLNDNKLDDFAGTSYAECLVRKSVGHQLIARGFTGFNTNPVNVRTADESNSPMPQLVEIEVTGWGGMASVQSGIERIERCPVCGFQTYTKFTNPGQLIDEAIWDGSDFFLVWPMPLFFITDRVASFIKAEKLTGVDVVEPHQFSSSKLIRILGPVPLRYRFPEERARLIGEPLDIY